MSALIAAILVVSGRPANLNGLPTSTNLREKRFFLPFSSSGGRHSRGRPFRQYNYGYPMYSYFSAFDYPPNTNYVGLNDADYDLGDPIDDGNAFTDGADPGYGDYGGFGSSNY